MRLDFLPATVSSRAYGSEPQNAMSLPEQLGPYRILDLIGQGGMGAVYTAVHSETQSKAAVKVLSASLGSQEGFRERFRVEIETLKKLRHPNIVTLYGYGEQDGILFYAMELVEGKSLQQLLEEGRQFTWQEVTELGIQICHALKHAQDHGVIHRDLKPANLLLTDAGELRLSDFGIAKLFGAAQMTVDGGVIGTIHYMSPEQASGERVTARSDLYSLGAVLYTLLARRPPFVAESAAEVLHALKYDEPAPISHHVLGLPPELDRIIMQLLEKDPRKRVATPLAAANRLKAMLLALKDQPERKDFFSHPTADAQTIEATPSQMGLENHGLDATRTLDPDNAPLSQDAAPLAPATQGVQYTEVPDRERADVTSEDDAAPAWVTAAMVAVGLLVIAGFLYFLTRPPGADKLYQQIVAAKDDPDELGDVDHVMEDFLERFPGDPRRAEVEELRKRLKRQRMQRRFERRARRLGDVDQLRPIERAYLMILRVMPEDPERALRLTDALLALYETDPPPDDRVRECLELVRIQREGLATRVRRLQVSEVAALRSRMEAIAEVQSESPEQAALMYRSLIELYEGRSWAQPFVVQAKAALEELKRSREPPQPNASRENAEGVKKQS